VWQVLSRFSFDFTTPREAVRTVAGGIVAAPLIGLLVGYIARRFSFLSRRQQIWVALLDLYLATYLFLLATGAGQVANDLIVRGRVEELRRAIVVDPFLGTLLGLTYTGFVLVLFPLSYFNHLLIGKMWERAGA